MKKIFLNINTSLTINTLELELISCFPVSSYAVLLARDEHGITTMSLGGGSSIAKNGIIFIVDSIKKDGCVILLNEDANINIEDKTFKKSRIRACEKVASEKISDLIKTCMKVNELTSVSAFYNFDAYDNSLTIKVYKKYYMNKQADKYISLFMNEQSFNHDYITTKKYLSSFLD